MGDILSIEGGICSHKPLEQRLKYIKDGVLIPRKKDEARGGGGHVYSEEPIKIRSKDYFGLDKLSFVLKNVCAGVGHEALGVRFVPTGEYGVSAIVWKKGGDV